MAKKTELKEPRTARIVYPEPQEEDKPLYANALLVNHTPWDFALHFSTLIAPTRAPTGQNLEIKGSAVAVINIPVTLVRGLITALETNMAAYEKSYGKIEIPKGTKVINGNGSAE
jgi:hypothetical protein